MVYNVHRTKGKEDTKMNAYIIDTPTELDRVVAIDLNTAARIVAEAAFEISGTDEHTPDSVKQEILATIKDGDTRAYFFVWDDDFHSEKLTVDICPIRSNEKA
jgi:hypothetical protein